MFSKPLILALLVSISFNITFGYLSYSFYSDKAVAESQLETAVKANKGLQESLDKKDIACKITDSTVAEYQEENQGLVGKKDSDLNAIDTKPALKTNTENVAKKATNVAQGATQHESRVVDIDGELPDSLVRLLSESCSRAKGSTCAHP